jgi:hypothetical protein
MAGDDNLPIGESGHLSDVSFFVLAARSLAG